MGKPLHSGDRRRIPLSGQRVRLGTVNAHCQVEVALWGRKPITFLFFAGTFVLKIQIQRSISVVFERHPTTDRKSVERVSNLIALCIIEGDRPESVRRRGITLLEVQRVFVSPVKRLTGFVAQIHWIESVLRYVRAE